LSVVGCRLLVNAGFLACARSQFLPTTDKQQLATGIPVPRAPFLRDTARPTGSGY
jgi:hypothetical protein